MATEVFFPGRSFVGIRKGFNVHQSHLRVRVRVSLIKLVITFSGDCPYRPNALATLFTVNEIENAFRNISFKMELKVFWQEFTLY